LASASSSSSLSIKASPNGFKGNEYHGSLPGRRG
jgi:hypothetical protein